MTPFCSSSPLHVCDMRCASLTDAHTHTHVHNVRSQLSKKREEKQRNEAENGSGTIEL